MHKRTLASKVAPIKKQKYADLRVLVNECKLSGPNEEFAFARYLKATEYARFSQETGCIAKYNALRREMGLSPIGVESDIANPTGIAPGE